MNAEDVMLAFLGVAMGFILGISLASIKVDKFIQCRDAQMNGLPIVWQEDEPFCMIDVNVNGKTKTVNLNQYYEYIK